MSKTCNVFALGAYGKTGLRKHDLIRHFSGARSAFHQDAVKWQTQEVSEKKMTEDREDVPTSAQFHIAYAILKENPLAASGEMYEKRCLDARGSGDSNVSPYRCSRIVFAKITRALGLAIMHDVHRTLATRGKHKNPPQWACLAEDNGGGISQKCLRVVFKNYEAKDILLDWSHCQGKKKAQYLILRDRM